LRRFLLFVITALIVARPLVLGEDPGLLDHASGTAGLTLTLLWFLAAVGWAAWRGWSGQVRWPIGAVEGGLLVIVGAITLSATGAASYKYPAWLIASEWLTFLIAFVLVRQLARTEGDGRRVLAALLASAVSLSAYGLFQRTVELPDQHKLFENPQQLRQAYARQEGIYLNENDPVLEHWKNRVQANTVFATFAHPNSFASFLALLLPAAVAWTLASRSRIEDRGSRIEDGESRVASEASGPLSQSSILHPRSSIKTWLGGACALLTAVAIWLTNSRGAILASAVAVGAVIALYPPMWWTKKSRLAGIAAAAVAVILLVLFVNRPDPLKEEASGTLQKRLDYWSATLGMIRDHPWLGVGPGHFGRFYPRYMKETAYQKIKDPHNFALEMWSTCGIVALIALLVTLAAFFWKTRRICVGSQIQQEQEKQEPERGGTRTRWEFYLGGMAGLIVGFLLWTLDLSKENISDQLIYGGFLAGLRSLIWFAAFGLYESLAWGGRPRTLALVLGVVALLANLSISGGISFPSVAQPMWIVGALALNSLPQPISAPQQRSWFATMAPLPIAVVACLGVYVFICSPVISCSTPLREARKYYGTYAIKMANAQSAESPSAAQKSGAEARDVLRHIVSQLQLAAWGSPKHKENAVLADPFVELAQWKGEEWKQVYRKGAPLIEARQQAASAAKEATRLDPEGTEGYWAQYQANMTFAKAATTEVRKFYEFASQAMGELVKRDPTEARFHFLLADLWYLLDDTASWEKEAQEALRLDEISTDPTRKLKPSQRLRILSRRQPNDTQLQFQLAEALEREGLEEEVKPVAREIGRLDREAQGDAKLTEPQRRQVEAWLKSG
jgi:O-antigen ligase